MKCLVSMNLRLVSGDLKKTYFKTYRVLRSYQNCVLQYSAKLDPSSHRTVFPPISMRLYFEWKLGIHTVFLMYCAIS